MDLNHTIERHREMLQRIVALLFALADLANRASARSRRVRCEVLFILSHGEAVAREFIIEEAQASGTPILYLPAPACDDGGSAGHAMRLAARFRALAAILAYIWAQTLPAAPRQRPRYSLVSDLSCPAHATRQIRRARRGLGFRALDSPKPFQRGG
jgi:hypothetical protein